VSRRASKEKEAAMFDRREKQIRSVLRKLSQQRVALVLQPGNYWVIEKAIGDDEETDTALLTCYMRGWVEPIEGAIPSGRLNPDGSLPSGFQFDKVKTHYRLTSAGWSVINGSHRLSVIALTISIISLAVSVLANLHFFGK
jgi:hypothetical protein